MARTGENEVEAIGGNCVIGNPGATRTLDKVRSLWNEDCRREIETLQFIGSRGHLISRHDGVFDGLPDIQSATS